MLITFAIATALLALFVALALSATRYATYIQASAMLYSALAFGFAIAGSI